MKYVNQKAFTLPELVVVVIILAILSTLGFVQYSAYTSQTRDAVRLADMKEMSSGLMVYQTKNRTHPMPQDYITLTSGGQTLAYQGYFWDLAAATIELPKTPTDPGDNSKYTYIVNSRKSDFQLLTHLENEDVVAFDVPGVYASRLALSKRYIHSVWDELGALVVSDGTWLNTPIQNFRDSSSFTTLAIDTFNWTLPSGENVGDITAVLNDWESFSWTGWVLQNISLHYNQQFNIVMSECPKGWKNRWYFWTFSGWETTALETSNGKKMRFCQWDDLITMENIYAMSCTSGWNEVNVPWVVSGSNITPIQHLDTTSYASAFRLCSGWVLQTWDTMIMQECPLGWKSLWAPAVSSGVIITWMWNKEVAWWFHMCEKW